MVDITDPQAITFCNEQIRPLAEKFRALKAECDSTIVAGNTVSGRRHDLHRDNDNPIGLRYEVRF